MKLPAQIEIIRRAFNELPLPGEQAMLEMAPAFRRSMFRHHEESHLASVMMLLYPEKEELFFPLIIRTSHNHGDKHRGQIGLPGGKLEKSDADHWACALRETEEELGIDCSSVQLIGELTQNYIPISNYRVRPFVGLLNEKPKFSRQESEVEEIIEVPLRQLLEPGSRKIGDVSLAGGIRLNEIPYFQLVNHKVWGATAMMLNEFVSLIQSNSLLSENADSSGEINQAFTQ